MIEKWSSGGASTQTNATSRSANQRQRAVAALVAHPAAVAQLDGHAVRLERADQAVELVELVPPGLNAGRQLHQVRAQLAGLGERRRLLHEPLRQRRLQLGRQRHAAAPGRLAPRRAGPAAASRSGAEWRDSSRCALTSKTKPSGVSSTHLWTVVRSGTA